MLNLLFFNPKRTCFSPKKRLHWEKEEELGRKEIPNFILDFLCIHPFNDGNGRMSRLLTLLLLYRSGYIVGQYISIEKAIADTKETYYEVLQQADQNWYEGENDPKPFIKYMLGIILSCYREFESRVTFAESTGKKVRLMTL